jgi:DnaJ homolog subfamily C member 28
MDYKDHRASPTTTDNAGEPAPTYKASKYRGKRFHDYIEEIMQEAMERGEFDNLAGTGQPLNLHDEYLDAGEKAAAYRLLKNNGYAPPEIDLLKEIRRERARMEEKLERLRARGDALRRRTVPPFESEKRAYNATVEKAISDYEEQLRELNRKILTLNLTVPPPMHLPALDVEKLVRCFQDTCPPVM